LKFTSNFNLRHYSVVEYLELPEESEHETAPAVAAALPVGWPVTGRGLHSSTSQLNLVQFRHKIHTTYPLMPSNTPRIPRKQPLHNL
jgi:hypothetical protein